MALTKLPSRAAGTMVQRTLLKKLFALVAPMLVILFVTAFAAGQTTSFTYQGALSDGGSGANGNYDLQFSLWDSLSGGNQAGSTQTLNAVPVSNGIFSVTLDFGGSAFPGGTRFLEISTRPSGSLSYTLLTPRQEITSTPYAIRSGRSATADNALTANNATQLGGVAASQYVQTSDSRLSDARSPTAGSGSYIQNNLNAQSANFNITGNGTVGGAITANTVSSNTSYLIGNNPVLKVNGGVGSAQNSNTFTGVGAGAATTPLADVNGSGNYNSFYGRGAGSANTTGRSNSIFGIYAGALSTTSDNNSLFGGDAGYHITTGSSNSFFGYGAGFNTTNDDNSFFGYDAGYSNTTGTRNVFVGWASGLGNTTGNYVTLIGTLANVGQPFLTNATAIGAKAQVSHANSLVLGSINGVNTATADTFVGIGTTTPNALFHIAANNGNIVMGNAGCASSFVGLGFGASLSGCANYSLLGNGTDTIVNRPTGGGIFFRESNTTQMSIAPGGAVSITTLGAGGLTSLCRNFLNQISTCSSSLRYKKDLLPFTRGLSLLNQLKPITFKWKSDNSLDLGFGAEDIAAVEPLLVTHNAKGEVEGVKYDRITAVLVNAVKEQQEQIKQQQQQIANLTRVVCRRQPRASVCK